MANNVRITFRHIRPFEELVGLIKREADKLQESHPSITNCKVVIDQPHQRRTHGKYFRVQVMVSVPGKQLISSSEATEGYYDILTAVSDAFNAAEDSVSSYLRRRNDGRYALRDARSSPLWKYSFGWE